MLFGRRHRLVLAFLGICLMAPSANAGDRPCDSREPVNTLTQLWDALYACWQPPAGSDGLEITLVFSVRRNGTIIGKPRVTWTKLAGADIALQKSFVGSVLAALDKSLPLPLTDSMGGAIAGRPFALRFAARKAVPEQAL